MLIRGTMLFPVSGPFPTTWQEIQSNVYQAAVRIQTHAQKKQTKETGLRGNMLLIENVRGSRWPKGKFMFTEWPVGDRWPLW